jgi:hypothetical protein
MFKAPIGRLTLLALALPLTTSMLNGCASGPSQVQPAHTALGAGIVQRSGTEVGNIPCLSAANLLYVSQTALNTVNIYPNPQNVGNPAPVAFITPSQGLNAPAGMILANNNQVLYVANTGAQNVLLFKRCGSGPGATLNDSPLDPVDVAVSSTNDVYVSNANAANVTVFPAGSLNYNPALTLADSTARRGVGITIDRFGNCFWSFVDFSGQGRVDKFVGCSMPGATLALGGPPIKIPGGVQLDFPQNRLLLNDEAAPATRRFNPPLYNGVGAWVSTASTTPVFLSLRNNEQRLYVADQLNGVVQRYVYPSGALQPPITNSLSTTGMVTGVAVYPAAPL